MAMLGAVRCAPLPASGWAHPRRTVSAESGVYTGEWTTMALCGFIRGMGEGDGCLDRLWTKCYEEHNSQI